MRTKKKNRNEYAILDNGVWVRNFIASEAPPIDANSHLFSQNDLEVCLHNELQNYKLHLSQISLESVYTENLVIVSDGYKFMEKKEALLKLPKEIGILGTNNILNKWACGKYVRPMTYYIANNPYAECMSYLNKNVFYPPCIASVRTFPGFTQQYIKHNNVFLYLPVYHSGYSGLDHGSRNYLVDDYRNPICAALGLAYRFKAKRILLFCSSYCFEEERPTAVQIEKNLWSYPQQIMASEVIDAYIKWLTKADIRVGYHGEGPKLYNAEYITSDTLMDFFK